MPLPISSDGTVCVDPMPLWKCRNMDLMGSVINASLEIGSFWRGADGNHWVGSARSWLWPMNASLLQSSEGSVMTTTWISVLSTPGLDSGTAFSSWSTPSLISASWWSSLKGSSFQEVLFWSDYSSNGKITHSTSSLITNLLQNVFSEMREVSFWLIVPAWEFSDLLGFVSKLELNSNWYIFM